MSSATGLDRFIGAQGNSFEAALAEIKAGKKRTHWMWYIFPQISGLGQSETSKYYSIQSIDEAVSFLQHPVLGKRLMLVCDALVGLETDDAHAIFGSPDDLKLKSCMTLFSSLQNADAIFERVLARFFRGSKDIRTLEIMDCMKRNQ
jgi:uncharacterized protein (DUF1810 family)